MCLFKVCIIKEKEWIVIVKGENGEIVCLVSLENEKYVRDFLSKMSGKKYVDDWKEMKIGICIVVQVNWFKYLCEVLLLNVVFFDIFGFGENFESDEVVIELCREVDIIVVVMDVMFLMKVIVSKIFIYFIW